jgi:hypothetical protein
MLVPSREVPMKIPDGGRVPPHARPAAERTSAPAARIPRTTGQDNRTDGLEAPRPPRLGAPAGPADPLAAIPPASAARWPHEPSFAPLINAATRTYAVPPQIVAAWLAVEIGRPADQPNAFQKLNDTVGSWTSARLLPRDWRRPAEVEGKVEQQRVKIALAVRTAAADLLAFGDYGGQGPGLGLAGLKPSWMFTTRDYFRANYPGTEMARAAEFSYTDWRQPQPTRLAENGLRAAEIVQPGSRAALTGRENVRFAELLSADEKNVTMLAAQLRMVKDTLYGADSSGALGVDQAAQILGYPYTRSRTAKNRPELYRGVLEQAIREGAIPYY